jgi:hypothetical protein
VALAGVGVCPAHSLVIVDGFRPAALAMAMRVKPIASSLRTQSFMARIWSSDALTALVRSWGTNGSVPALSAAFSAERLSPLGQPFVQT